MNTNSVNDPSLRIGGVTYLNSKPLTEHLPELFPEAVIRDEYPSRLADDLANGRLDVALIPSIEYFRNENYEIVSDACVAARGPVLSVKLYSRVPWNEIRTLGLDEGSRTSAALAKILLGERFGIEPRTMPFPLGKNVDDCPADAVVMIGDRAIQPQDEKFHATWDLGEEWFRWTGLPFVFAMWVARRSQESVHSPSPLEGESGRRPDEGVVIEAANQTAHVLHSQSMVHHPLTLTLSPTGARGPNQNTNCVDTTAPGEIEDITDSQLLTLDARLSFARDLGEKSIPAIAEREASLLNLPLATTIHYLTKNLHYRLGSAERSGLKLFYELAVRRGLAPEGLKLVFRSHTCAG